MSPKKKYQITSFAVLMYHTITYLNPINKDVITITTSFFLRQGIMRKKGIIKTTGEETN